MQEDIYKIAIAGLLHDIGKLMQRAELEKVYPEIKDNYAEFCPSDKSYLHAAHTAYFIQHFVPDGLFDKTELYQAAHHHVSGSAEIYREADCLSAGMERYAEETESENFKEVRLNSVFDMVELQYAIRDRSGNLNSRWKHYLTPLSQRNCRQEYPQFIEDQWFFDGGFTYRGLWDGFIAEVKDLSMVKDITFYFNEIFWLLEKYTWCIPSATNVFPDISLFDHAKTTAAIASVLHLIERGKKAGEADFILYTGDISGIQEYLFKISQSQGVGGIAKRLRGRSFHVAMLSEVLSRYLLNKLGLTVTNINFCGGGNFELLLPNTLPAIEVLTTFEQEVNDWFLEQFHGELGLVTARVMMTKNELRSSFADKKDELNDAIRMEKLQKYRTHLDREDFWQEKNHTEKKTVCRSCNLNLITSGDICNVCEQDRKIGELLPMANYLTFAETAQRNDSICFGKFGSVTLWKDEPNRKTSNAVYAIEQDVKGVKALFRLARTVPKAIEEIDLPSEEDEGANAIVYTGRPLSFTTLAEMASGDRRIGVLKMDVDNLGFIFSMGLEAPPEYTKQSALRSISRLSTMSRQMGSFFTVHLDSICTKVFEKWRDDPANQREYKKAISNIFYLIFAGGDDLVIVGPWDWIIELAREIRKEFRDFTCHNPNITLSAGIYICKPKFPINHAVRKAEEALKQSKIKGKNRITVMGETVVWADEDRRSRVFQRGVKERYPKLAFRENEIAGERIFLTGHSKSTFEAVMTFEELMEFSEFLLIKIDKEHISQGFVRSLFEAKEQFFKITYNDQIDRFEEQQNLMFLPYLLYSIERNVHKESRNELKTLLVTGGKAKSYIRQAYYPCRYIFMKRRQERR